MKYKVLKEFVLNGVVQKENSIIELDNKMAALKSIQANIEKAPENAPVTGKESSVLSTVVPGQPLTAEQKEKLAKENVELTNEANRLAAEKHAQDILEGKGEPVVKSVAESLQNKLVNEEFKTKENEPNQTQNQPGDGGQTA